MPSTRPHSVIPGFGLTLGYSVSYLSLIVLIPLAALVFRGTNQPWADFKTAVFDTRTLLAWRLTFGTAFIASLINAFFGLIVAWVLARYDFPGRRILDALIDIPFALPTAVSGIALTAIYAPNGWIGHLLQPLGIKAAFSPLGIVIAMTFIGLPFIVRTVQPTIEDLDPAVEEAAALLGAPRFTALRRVILPAIRPALIAGFATAFARSLGEYGSVIFISGNMPMKTEIASLLIVTKLQQFDYAGASAIALLMLVTSFVLLFMVNSWAMVVHPCPSARGSAGGLAAGSFLIMRGHRHTEAPWVRLLLTLTAIAFVGVLILLPVIAVFTQALRKGLAFYIASITDPLALSALRLTLLTAAVTIAANLIFGLMASWLIAKFSFPGKSLLLSLIDIPFAVSPVIAGLIFILVFGAQGWFGNALTNRGIQIIFATPGIILATIFVTFPFIARELIPLMQEQGSDEEEAAVLLGANGWHTFWRVTLPNIRWALVYGVILANARAMGEFGAVSVVSGHIRGRTNTLPLHVEILYNEYNFSAAFAVASLLTLLALVTLLAKAALEWKIRAEQEEPWL